MPGQIGEPHRLALEPVAIRTTARDVGLHLVVGDDPSGLDVDEEELSGLEAPLPLDLTRGDVEDPCLRGEHDPPVLRLQPPAGAQAVPVERRADHPPVRERQRRRPVPRLDQAAVVGVEPFELGRQVAGAVGLRHHHHQRVRERPARQHEQLEHVVEGRRVGAAGANHRQHLRQVVAEELRRELRFARAHPVGVAADRVELAVVRDEPVRVRELPARKGVGREPRVHERERARKLAVAQVGEVAPELRRGQHSLVDDRP